MLEVLSTLVGEYLHNDGLQLSEKGRNLRNKVVTDKLRLFNYDREIQLS